MEFENLGCDKICSDCIYGGDFLYDEHIEECIRRKDNVF